MKLKTEEYAKTLWCPFADVEYCGGSKCMAWEFDIKNEISFSEYGCCGMPWPPDGYVYYNSNTAVRKEPLGFCALIHKDNK